MVSGDAQGGITLPFVTVLGSGNLPVTITGSASVLLPMFTILGGVDPMAPPHPGRVVVLPPEPRLATLPAERRIITA